MKVCRTAKFVAPANQVCSVCGFPLFIKERHTLSHDGYAICLQGHPDGRHNDDPIFYDLDQKMWFFNDETWTGYYGPFHTFEDAHQMLKEYVFLLG